jgi:hypothetical protein
VIRIQPFPMHDDQFAARVRAAVGRIAPGAAAGEHIEAPSEDALRRALADIRRDYPDIWIRKQDPLGAGDRETTTWYAFRDETPGTSQRWSRSSRQA